MAKRKEYRWFRLQGNFYGYNFPESQSSLNAAKQWIKNWLKVDRLPNGTEIW
jgi:hypothetical protein